MKGIVAGKSTIDKSFQMFIVYPEYPDYNTVFKALFNSHGVGFLIPGKKQMYIDGVQMENLTKDHFLAIQAHEISHYRLSHEGNYSEDDELEADVEGYKILVDMKHRKAAQILRQRIKDFYGNKGLKLLDEKRNKVMKHLKNFKINEGNTKADFNLKIRELKEKIDDTEDKIDDLTEKLKDIKDPLKNELLTLTIQKLDFKLQMLEVDLKINRIKRSEA